MLGLLFLSACTAADNEGEAIGQETIGEISEEETEAEKSGGLETIAAEPLEGLEAMGKIIPRIIVNYDADDLVLLPSYTENESLYYYPDDREYPIRRGWIVFKRGDSYSFYDIDIDLSVYDEQEYACFDYDGDGSLEFGASLIVEHIGSENYRDSKLCIFDYDEDKQDYIFYYIGKEAYINSVEADMPALLDKHYGRKYTVTSRKLEYEGMDERYVCYLKDKNNDWLYFGHTVLGEFLEDGSINLNISLISEIYLDALDAPYLSCSVRYEGEGKFIFDRAKIQDPAPYVEPKAADTVSLFVGDTVMEYDLDGVLIDGSVISPADGAGYMDCDCLYKLVHFEQSGVSIYCYDNNVHGEAGIEYEPNKLILVHDGVYDLYDGNDSDIGFECIWYYDDNQETRDFDTGFEYDCDGDGEPELLYVIQGDYGSGISIQFPVVFDYNEITGKYDLYYINDYDYDEYTDEAINLFFKEQYGISYSKQGKFNIRTFDDGYQIHYGMIADMRIMDNGVFNAQINVLGNPYIETGGSGNDIGTLSHNISYMGNGRFSVKAEKYHEWEKGWFNY